MGQRYNDNTKMLKPKENQLGILSILPENLAEGLERVRLGLHIYENTPKELPHLPAKNSSNWDLGGGQNFANF